MFYCEIEHGTMSINNCIIMNFSDLQNGHTYLMDGGFWRARTDTDIKDHQQAKYALLERETTLAVKSSIDDPSNTHMHHNYRIKKDNRIEAEFDRLIHIGGANIPNSKVYLIECRCNPPMEMIDGILKRVEIFRSHIPVSDQFKTVTDIQCVLGGQTWDSKVIARCKENRIWRVAPNGLRYTLYRNFFTLCKRLFK
jgi:hypothetical protein